MKLVHKYPILGSSVNPEKVSLTIKSVGAWLIPLATYLLMRYNINISESELSVFINAVAVAAGSLMTVYGLGRKLYYKIIKK